MITWALMSRFFARAHRLGVDGRFRLLGQLSEDPLGSIWTAEEPALGRAVTIRLIAESLREEDGFTDRFAAATERLLHPIIIDGALRPRICHPNAARVYHVDLGGASPAFVVTESFEGDSLAALLRREGRLDVEEAVRIASAVARALDSAHEVGIVHGGVNPTNVFIDAQGEVKVCDFGVATAGSSYVGRMDDELSRYLAPELRAGRDPTSRSDTFAVGATLWAMLTGSPPGPGGLAVTEQVPRPLAEVPGPIARLCGHALAQDPLARPDSSEDFASGLAVALSAARDAKGRQSDAGRAGGPIGPPSPIQTQEEKRQVSTSSRHVSGLSSLTDPASVEASLRKLLRDREKRVEEVNDPPPTPSPPSTNRRSPKGDPGPDQRVHPPSDEAEELRTED